MNENRVGRKVTELFNSLKYFGYLTQQEHTSPGLQACVQNSVVSCEVVRVIAQVHGVLAKRVPRYSTLGTVGPILGISVLRKNFLPFL